MQSACVLLLLTLPLAVHGVRGGHNKPTRTPPPPPQHKPPSVTIVPGQYREIDQKAERWDRRFGPRMTQLMQKKSMVEKRLADLSKRISNSESMSDDERKFQVLAMEMFANELNETEQVIVQAMQWLESVLKGDYKVFVQSFSSSLCFT